MRISHRLINHMPLPRRLSARSPRRIRSCRRYGHASARWCWPTWSRWSCQYRTPKRRWPSDARVARACGTPDKQRLQRMPKAHWGSCRAKSFAARRNTCHGSHRRTSLSGLRWSRVEDEVDVAGATSTRSGECARQRKRIPEMDRALYPLYPISRRTTSVGTGRARDHWVSQVRCGRGAVVRGWTAPDGVADAAGERHRPRAERDPRAARKGGEDHMTIVSTMADAAVPVQFERVRVLHERELPRCGTRLRRTCWRRGTTSGPCESCRGHTDVTARCSTPIFSTVADSVSAVPADALGAE